MICPVITLQIYLYGRESKWIDKQVKNGRKDLAKSLTATSRYIDDLLTINDNKTMTENWTEIYPSNLELKQENESPTRTHILDLQLVINDRRFESSIYDKRDEFPFTVNYMPDLSGNVHFRKGHGVVLGQLLRYANNCDKVTAFSKRTQQLTTTLINQHFDKDILQYYCLRFFEERKDFKRKFKLITDTEILQACFRPT